MWATINERISGRHFSNVQGNRGMFLSSVPKHYFGDVGGKILNQKRTLLIFKRNDPMYDANVKATGGYISGEVKVAIILSLLTDSNALDLVVMFDVHSDHYTVILYQVLSHWIIKPNIGNLNIEKYLGAGKIAMSKKSKGFAKRSNSNFVGAICAIDLWLVYIARPSMRDLIINPLTFFSRKGCYSLNVQCIVDDRNNVMGLSYSHKGVSMIQVVFKK